MTIIFKITTNPVVFRTNPVIFRKNSVVFKTIPVIFRTRYGQDMAKRFLR